MCAGVRPAVRRVRAWIHFTPSAAVALGFPVITFAAVSYRARASLPALRSLRALTFTCASRASARAARRAWHSTAGQLQIFGRVDHNRLETVRQQ